MMMKRKIFLIILFFILGKEQDSSACYNDDELLRGTEHKISNKTNAIKYQSRDISQEQEIGEESVHNFFTHFPCSLFLRILSFCDHKTIQNLYSTSKNINLRIKNYGKIENKKQIEFFELCHKTILKTGNFVQDTRDFIFQMEKMVSNNSEEYKDILAPLLYSYCYTDNFNSWYIKRLILQPIFKDLMYTKNQETWVNKFKRTFDIFLLDKPSYLFVIQFFVDRGVNIDCPVKFSSWNTEDEGTLLTFFLDSRFQYCNYWNCKASNIVNFLIKNGAVLDQEMQKKISISVERV